MSLYFSKKQFFRDTTAPEGLSEVIRAPQVLPPVRARVLSYRNPETLDRRNDYFGNELLTIRDRNGHIKTISLMKGANKPRGIDANVKWSMAPNKFRRGRGLRTDPNLFYEPPKRRQMTTEFFKSRYQSAYDEMLIEKRIRDSEKVGANKLKILNEQNKKLQDKLDATLQSNKIAEQRLAQDQKNHDQLLLALSNARSTPNFSIPPELLRPTAPQASQPAPQVSGSIGDAISAALGDKPKDKPRKKTPEELEKEQEALRAAARAGVAGETAAEELARLAAAGGGVLTPSQLKELRKEQKKAAKQALIEGGDSPVLSATPSTNVPLDLSKLPTPPPPPKGKGKGKGKGKDDIPDAPPSSQLTLEDIKEEEEDQPSLAPQKSAGAESAISVSDTPRSRERKLRFFGRRGGQLQEVDIAKLDEEGVKAVRASTAFNDEEKIEILKGLKGKMSDKVRKEAERQLKIISGELEETASATIGGEKQTSTPRPPLTEKIAVDNPLDSETTDEEDEPSAVAALQKDLGKEAVKEGVKKQTASNFISATGLPKEVLERPKLIEDWIRNSSSEAEFRSRIDLTNQYLKGVSKTPYSQKWIDNEIRKFNEKNTDFYTPSFPHEEIGEVVESKEFKAQHDRSKFKNPVQIKFGEARVGGALGIRGGMGYIADLDDVKRTFDATEPPTKPKSSKSKGAKQYNAWKQAKWRLDNWDEIVKDKPYKHYTTPEFNEEGVLEAKVMKGKTDDKQRVNEIFLPATQGFADAFGVDFDRHNELFEETKKRGGQAAAIRKFKKGEVVSFGGKKVKVVEQKGDDILVETEDGEVMVNLDDLD